MAEPRASDATLRTYLQVLRRQSHWVLALTVLSVAGAVAYSAIQDKQYSATAQLLAEPASGTVPISGTQQTISSTDVLTDLQLISGAPVKAIVQKSLGFSPKVSASEVGQTNVINLTATAASPELASKIANTYARSFVSYQRTNALNALTAAESHVQSQITAITNQLAPLIAEKSPSSAITAEISGLASQQAALQGQLTQLQLAGSETPGGIEVTSLAILPTSPSSPKPLEDALIAFVIGLVLGIAAALAIEYFDDKVYTKDQAERLTDGVPVLAIVPNIKSWRNGNRPLVVTEIDPFSPVSESYRSLRTSLQFAGHDKVRKTLLVTSAAGVEGKTSTVTNLGVVLAKAGERVVVVGCDLRRPRLGSFLGLSETPGFTSILVGQGDLRENLRGALQPVPSCPGLALLGTGPIPPNPAELLASERSAEIFRVLATGFDTILIDSAPLLPVADAQILAGLSDSVLLVVMAGKTTTGEIQRAVELLDQVDSRPTGIVLNRATRRGGSGEYPYGYAYKYRYTPQPSRESGRSNGHPEPPLARTKSEPTARASATEPNSR
jgi:polysaccharide biosynthesis transport protein